MARSESPLPSVEFRREWIDRKAMIDPLRPLLKGQTIECRYDPRQDRYERWYTVPTYEFDSSMYGMMGSGTYTTTTTAPSADVWVTNPYNWGHATDSTTPIITPLGMKLGGQTIIYNPAADTQEESDWEHELMADGWSPVVTAEGEKTPEYSKDGRLL